jgi:hypothetical protein
MNWPYGAVEQLPRLVYDVLVDLINRDLDQAS